jgi:hypothetical protein
LEGDVRRFFVWTTACLLIVALGAPAVSEGVKRDKRLRAAKAKKERLIEVREKGLKVAAVGEDYINLNERKFYVNSGTAIYGKKGEKIALRSIGNNMKVDIEYRFDEKFRPVLLTLRVVSGR